MSKRTSLVMIGSGGVGKSALTIRLMTNGFTKDYDPTIEDNYMKSILIDEIVEHIDVLDTAGQEEFQSMMDGWIRQAHGIVLVYDVSNRQSFDELDRFYNKIMEIDETMPVLLVGNKCDVDESVRKVYLSEGKHMAESIFHCAFMEASAKERINDIAIFYQIVRMIRQKRSVTKVAKEVKKNLLLCCFSD